MGKILQREELVHLIQSNHFREGNWGYIKGNDEKALNKLRRGLYDVTYDSAFVTPDLLHSVIATDHASRTRFKQKYPDLTEQDIGFARIYGIADNPEIAFEDFVLEPTIPKLQRAYNLHYILLNETKKDYVGSLADRLLYDPESIETIFTLLCALGKDNYDRAEAMLLRLASSTDFSPKIKAYLVGDNNKDIVRQPLRTYPKLGNALIHSPKMNDPKELTPWLPFLDHDQLLLAAKKKHLDINALVTQICDRFPKLIQVLYQERYLNKLTKQHFQQMLDAQVPETVKLITHCQNKTKNVFKLNFANIINRATNPAHRLTVRQKSLAYYLIDCTQYSLLYNNLLTPGIGEGVFTLMDPSKNGLNPERAKNLFFHFIAGLRHKTSNIEALNDYLNSLFEVDKDAPTPTLLKLLRANKAYSDALLILIKEHCADDPKKIEFIEYVPRALHYETFNNMLRTNLARRSVLPHTDIEHYVRGGLLTCRLLDAPPNSREQRELAATILKPRGIGDYITRQLFSWQAFRPEWGYCYIPKIDRSELWAELLIHRIPNAAIAFKFYLEQQDPDTATIFKDNVVAQLGEKQRKIDRQVQVPVQLPKAVLDQIAMPADAAPAAAPHDAPPAAVPADAQSVTVPRVEILSSDESDVESFEEFEEGGKDPEEENNAVVGDFPFFDPPEKEDEEQIPNEDLPTPKDAFETLKTICKEIAKQSADPENNEIITAFLSALRSFAVTTNLRVWGATPRVISTPTVEQKFGTPVIIPGSSEDEDEDEVDLFASPAQLAESDSDDDEYDPFASPSPMAKEQTLEQRLEALSPLARAEEMAKLYPGQDFLGTRLLTQDELDALSDEEREQEGASSGSFGQRARANNNLQDMDGIFGHPIPRSDDSPAFQTTPRPKEYRLQYANLKLRYESILKLVSEEDKNLFSQAYDSLSDLVGKLEADHAAKQVDQQPQTVTPMVGKKGIGRRN